MLNGLDLFSGIGGISLALSPWVRPVAYCECDKYAQAVLLSQISRGTLPIAPIWDDIRTLTKNDISGIDIIYGGFPCQDISVAGHGKGLEGERSGLFFEICRLAKELKPTFLFLENVSAITGRGLDVVGKEISEMGYDCRWCCLSAAEVGANHRRERWWLLAHARRKPKGTEQNLRSESKESIRANIAELCGNVSNTDGEKCTRLSCGEKEEITFTGSNGKHIFESEWWATEPDVGRVANGVLNRVDRIKCLGNAVVPIQAREAFKELMGITP